MTKFKKYILPAFTLAIFLFALLICFCGDFFLMALLKSYVVQSSVVVFVFAFILLLIRKWWQALLTTFSCILLFSVYSSFLFVREIEMYEGAETIAESVKVLQFNVLKGNENKEETIELILDQNADLVMLEEINEEWGSLLKEKMPFKYPYYKINSREDFFGIALFSKYPIAEFEVFEINYFPGITAIVNYKDIRLRVFGIHSKAPTTISNFKLRNDQINNFASTINKYEEPTLVLGDFNAVPWDDVINEFKEKTNLSDSRTSLAATFPSWGLFGKVPIDFIFCSSDLISNDFKVIENPYSDHYAISSTFYFRY